MLLDLPSTKILGGLMEISFPHRVTVIAVDKAIPNFGDVVVVHQTLKKPPPFENRGATGVCMEGGD